MFYFRNAGMSQERRGPRIRVVVKLTAAQEEHIQSFPKRLQEVPLTILCVDLVCFKRFDLAFRNFEASVVPFLTEEKLPSNVTIAGLNQFAELRLARMIQRLE